MKSRRKPSGGKPDWHPVNGPAVVRKLEVQLSQKASDVLDRRMAVEELNGSTIVCRALQVYEMVCEAQKHENGGILQDGRLVRLK